jgi:nucleotide-binding universal stress UspA family protein
MNSIANPKSRLSIGLHPRRILAVIDFEEGAQAVLDCALQYAEMHGASVHFLHVIESDSFLSGMGEVVLALSPEQSAEEARIALLTFMDQSDRRGLEALPMVRTGKLEREVMAAAEELATDLIIVPAQRRERGGWGRGSAEKIIQHAQCPVLVV